MGVPYRVHLNPALSAKYEQSTLMFSSDDRQLKREV